MLINNIQSRHFVEVGPHRLLGADETQRRRNHLVRSTVLQVGVVLVQIIEYARKHLTDQADTQTA